MANGSTQFDVAYFALKTGQHDATAGDIAAKLQNAADGDWKIAWVITTSEGVIMILQRPTPTPKPPSPSLGGYGSSGGSGAGA